MYIWWIPSRKKDIIFLSPKTLQNFNIQSEKITLHLGFWKQRLEIRPLDALDENTIGLPSLLAYPFTIPDTISFESYLEGENLHLGPVIAVVVKKGKLSQKRLRFWTDYCRNYAEINGLIYFCKVQGIDINTRTIKGHYFDPDGKVGEKWKPGIFPYPGVVFQRTRIPSEILQDLNNHTDHKVFNAYLFNKWEMWKAMSKAGFRNTPHTVMFRGIDSLKKMLELYPSVYLKPIKGRFAIGIQRVEKMPNGYLLKREYGSNLCTNLGQVYKFIQKYKKKGKYIVQQGVPFIYEGKAMDFRIILQKDATQKWVFSGSIAKLGHKGLIFTNAPSAIYLAKEALEMVFGLTPWEASEKENEIIGICKEACQIVEKAYGLLGDVGIDVVVDSGLNIWILEINKLHQHTMVINFKKDLNMYGRVVSRPLEFAKALAGFH